jgi:hypothetical protein
MQQKSKAMDSPPLPDAAVDCQQLSLSHPRKGKEQLVTALVANIQYFLKRLLPIMPIVDETKILSEVQRFDELPLPRQCFLLSLSAATRIQLKLDSVKERDNEEVETNAYLHSPLTGSGLLEAAKRLRRQFDVVDNMSLDAILTSFFLFAAHGNREEHNHAWFFLNESMTMAISMGLHDEEAYVNVPKCDRELRRRIFWLLFVTERFVYTTHPTRNQDEPNNKTRQDLCFAAPATSNAAQHDNETSCHRFRMSCTHA